MKKLTAVILAFAVTALLPLAVYADIDEPAFDDWYILCGMDGYDFDDYVFDDESEEEIKIRDHIEPGTRYQVHSYDPDTKEYLIIPADENYDSKGTGFIYVTEAEMNKRFLDPNKVVKEETGKKQDKVTNCLVSSSTGVVLRQGPAKTFPKYLVIPSETKLSYLYTYEYGGYHWGYTTYNGKDGWVCLDYTEAITAAPTQTTQSVPATPETQNAGETVKQIHGGAQVGETEAGTEALQNAPFFSNTSVVIIICCLGAVIIALCAVVILLIVKKKNN